MPELVFDRRGEEVLRVGLERQRLVLGRGEDCDAGFRSRRARSPGPLRHLHQLEHGGAHLLERRHNSRMVSSLSSRGTRGLMTWGGSAWGPGRWCVKTSYSMTPTAWTSWDSSCSVSGRP